MANIFYCLHIHIVWIEGVLMHTTNLFTTCRHACSYIQIAIIV